MYKAKEQYSIVQLPISQLNKNAKTENFTIAKLTISQIPSYNFELPVKHLPWTHNIILIQKVKDVRARYWYYLLIYARLYHPSKISKRI